MSNHSAANVHPFLIPFDAPQPWDAPDPLPVMRREMKLLLIELSRLRTEAVQLRTMEEEARNTKELLSASVNQILESRDQWRREAERLGALTARVPSWLLFWWRCLDVFKAWRTPTDQWWHCARAGQI
jgi:hypothetical protein